MESNVLEYKLELNDKFEKEIVAFLNTDGGKLMIGIDDHENIVGVLNADEVVLACINRLKDNIKPTILGIFNVSIQSIGHKNVIEVTVSSGFEKPYFIKKYGMTSKGCFLRSGSESIPMEQVMIESLFSKRVINTLHNVISPNQNLTFSQLKIFYQENGFDMNEYFLSNLGFYTVDGKFNYNAFLMSDNNSISIKVAKFSGNDKVDLISNNEYGYCCLVKATRNVLERLNIENITSTEITYGERNDQRLVDEKSLREAVINAIIHQDYINGVYPVFEIYKDRIDIVSSGGLPYGLTQEEFLQGKSVPRNQEIMRIFKDMNLVEQLGSGVKRILNAYDKNVFQFSPNFLTVSFMYNEEAKARLMKSQIELHSGIKYDFELTLQEKDIIEYLLKYQFIKRSTVEDILDVKKTKANKILSEMMVKKIICIEGKSSIVKYVLDDAFKSK